MAGSPSPTTSTPSRSRPRPRTSVSPMRGRPGTAAGASAPRGPRGAAVPGARRRDHGLGGADGGGARAAADRPDGRRLPGRPGSTTSATRGFLEPLAVLCEALSTDVELQPHGPGQPAHAVRASSSPTACWSSTRSAATRRSSTSPRGTDRHRRPPRTGTTHLHNLLSADPASARSYWESLERCWPTPSGCAPTGPRLIPTPAWPAPTPRSWFVNEALPHFVRMHEMTTQHRHEGDPAPRPRLLDDAVETTTPLPTYRDWFDATDQTAAYGYLRRVPPGLHPPAPPGRRGTDPLGAQVAPAPGPVRAAVAGDLPDATVVVTHREPWRSPPRWRDGRLQRPPRPGAARPSRHRPVLG